MNGTVYPFQHIRLQRCAQFHFKDTTICLGIQLLPLWSILPLDTLCDRTRGNLVVGRDKHSATVRSSFPGHSVTHHHILGS